MEGGGQERAPFRGGYAIYRRAEQYEPSVRTRRTNKNVDRDETARFFLLFVMRVGTLARSRG